MKNLTTLMQAQLEKMCATGKLFRSSISGSEVWNLYLKSFKSEDNPVFRDPESSTHNCNLCHNFVRRYGNIVAIDESNNIMTLWDLEKVPAEYLQSVTTVMAHLKSSIIKDVFFETFNELNYLPYESCKVTNTIFKLGIDKNVKRYTKEEAAKFGVVKENEIRTFDHFHLYLPAAFVDKSGASAEKIMADYRDSKSVFKRAMEEISIDTLLLVKDLINQGSLLDGKTHLYKVETIIKFKQEYDSVPPLQRDNWCWVNSYNNQFAKFKNELIGVLCSELAEGKELNEACKAWNIRVDPVNYMKASAPITSSQIKEAKKFIEENGYEDSFNRRFATIDDINASEILHVDVGNGNIKPVSIF